VVGRISDVLIKKFTMPSTHVKLDKKIILGLIAVFILCLVLLLQSIFVRPSSDSKPKFDTIELQSFSNYKYGDYFTVNSDIEFKTTSNTLVYKVSGINSGIESVKNAALKLGLSKEIPNVNTKITKWVKDDENVRALNSVTLDNIKGTVNVFYENGINEKPLESEDYLNYLKSFFGFPDMYEIYLISKETQQDSEFLNYGVKWQEKDIYFDQADNIFLSVTIVNKKIISVFFHLLPTEITDFKKLKPIDRVTKDNIASYYYQLSLKPEEIQSASEYGSETIVVPPVKVGLRGQKDAYILFNDPTLSWLLIPVIDFNGVFLDANNQKGSASLLIVNQNNR
jgi:hypothetical protein